MKTQSDDEVVEVESDDSCDCASGYMCLNKKLRLLKVILNVIYAISMGIPNAFKPMMSGRLASNVLVKMMENDEGSSVGN